MPILATIGGKIGAGVLSVALIAGAIWAYNARQQSIGYHEAKQEQAEAVEAQQQAVRVVEGKQYDALLDVVERTAAEKDKFYNNFIQKRREVLEKDAEIQRLAQYVDAVKMQQPDREVRYVELDKPAPCLVPDAVTARVDELAGVLNAIPYRRVSQDVGAVDAAPLQGSGAATCAQLVERIEVLTARLGDSLIAHRGLTEYVEQERAINATFHVHQRGE